MTQSPTLQKMESFGESKGFNRSEKGQVGFSNHITRFVSEMCRTELKYPQFLETAEQMMEDEAVSTSVNARAQLATLGMYWGKFVPKKSAKSKEIADFLNYNIRNMSYGSWMQVCKDANTDIIYGYSILYPVLEVRKHGKYAGKLCLKKISPRSQKSVYSWVFDNNYRELKGFYQKPMKRALRQGLGEYAGFVNSVTAISQDINYTYFKVDEVLLFSYDSVNNNPEGRSPLAKCFPSYLEKKIVEQYEIAGIAKDLGGILVVRSPSEVFEAAADEDHPNHKNAVDAKRTIETNAANLHKSETTFVHLSSEKGDHGEFLYDFELKGIQGGSSKYTTTDVITEKKKAIYTTLGVQALLLGQDVSGGNTLSKDQNTIFRYYVERDMEEKADVINNQLAKRILQANGMDVDWEDMPEFTPLNPFRLSLDEAGKIVQRWQSVGMLVPSMLESIYDDVGYEYDRDEIDELDFTSKGTSRAGESMGSSGVGDTQAAFGGDNNLENN